MNRFFPAKMYIFSKFPYPNDRLRLHPDVHGLHGAHHLHANVRTNILENGVYNYFYLKKVKNSAFAVGVLGLRLLLSVVLVLRFRLSPK